MTWRNFNALGVVFAVTLWIVAALLDWISSVQFVAHVVMLSLVVAFVAAWRTDVPNR